MRDKLEDLVNRLTQAIDIRRTQCVTAYEQDNIAMINYHDGVLLAFDTVRYTLRDILSSEVA